MNRASWLRCLATGLMLLAGAGAMAAPKVANKDIVSNASKMPLYWCDSTDTKKLDMVVTTDRGKCYLSNVAQYDPPDRNCYYFVNWDLQGTQQQGLAIKNLEVEPNSLYLVHLYEIYKPNNLGDFWAENRGKQACLAFVWVGNPAPVVSKLTPGPKLTEVKESPGWFYYTKGDRLPIYSVRFPEFKLPKGKLLSLAMSRTTDTFDSVRNHGVTHFQTGGGQSDKIPRSQRLATIGSYFNQGIGEKPSGDPHISPTENTFMRCDYSHVISKASIAKDFDYIFLDEEFWHNDYQPETIERLCLFAQEARKLNPTLKLADFWNPPVYTYTFMGHDGWSADKACDEARTHYDDVNAALKAGNQTLQRKVMVRGKETCLADELTAVSLCVYFDNLFGYIDQYKTFSNDFYIPAAIHKARVNKLLPCNQGKPIIWFGMEILEGNYNHPRLAYSTRTTNPPGAVIFKDRLPVSPNFNEAIGLFGMLESDGVYLWEPHGASDGDPNGIFQTMRYCIDYKDDRGEWLPDVAGTPIGNGKSWYPTYLYSAPDYYALGAWKYAQIADIVQRGKKTDFEYSTDGGKTWYIPPKNGGAMVDVIHDKRPIVTGAIAGQDVAVVVYDPFQGVADTTSLHIRVGKTVFPVNLFGTRIHVYKGKLAVASVKPRPKR